MIDVRPATVDDLPAMLDLHERVASEGRWIATEAPVDTDRLRRRFTESIEGADHLRLVAADGDRIVGNLGLSPGDVGVRYLGMALDADYRGRGLGTAMLHAAIDWARSQEGVHKIELEVWPHNAAGLALYRKLGFGFEGRKRRHHRRRNGELWDAIVMTLVLDDTSPGSPHADWAGLEQQTPG